MSRDLSARFADALAERNVAVALMLEAEFSSGTVRSWTGLGTLSALGYDWTGLGQLIGIGAVEETDDLKAAGLAVTLRGVKAADISLALGEMQLNKPGSIRLALFEPGELIGDPATGDLLGEDVAEAEVGEGADFLGEGSNVLGETSPIVLVGVAPGGLIDTPKILFKGNLDVAVIDDGDPSSPVLTINYENELIDLERPLEWRYTDQHQRRLHTNDRAFEYNAKLQDQEIVWGRR